MSDPLSPCSDQEQEGTVHEPPCLQECAFLKPLYLNLSTQRREAKVCSKSQLPDDLFYGSAENRPSGKVSCELHLGVGEYPRRVCRICHRQFLSGRALGGHMRVHGPLFKSAGTKRKLNPLECSQGASDGCHMEISDSKGSELSSVSRTFSENQGFRYDGADEPIMTSDSDGEAVDNAGPTTVASVERILVHTLHHNRKKSSRSEENELSMGMSLAVHPTLKGSVFPTLKAPRVCSECSKSFWSLKALFGHMRCHPERDWRGMSAPEDSCFMHKPEARFGLSKKMLFAKSRLMEKSVLIEPDSDVENKKLGTEIAFHHIKESTALVKAEHVKKHDFVDDDRVHEVSRKAECFEDTLRDDYDDGHRRWPTGKRSRRKFMSCSSLQRKLPALMSECGSLEETQEEQHEETPDFLLMLAEAARTIESKRHDLLQKTWHDCKNWGYGREEEPVLAMAAREAQAATVSTANGIVKYECSTCKKAFNSHQALGGHRASHRKLKGCFARNSVGDEAEEYSFMSNGLEKHHACFSVGAGEKTIIQRQSKEHECSVCHRIFSTGQALGGHKRCHYMGERTVEAANITSIDKRILYEDGNFRRSDAEGRSTLDLNMPAPVDENGEAGFSLQLRFFDANVSEESKQQCSASSLLLAQEVLNKVPL